MLSLWKAAASWADRLWATVCQAVGSRQVSVHGYMSSPCCVEGLEGRALFSSLTLSNGVINMVGDADAANQMSTVLSADGATITARVNNRTQVWASAAVSSIVVKAGNKGDNIKLDHRMYRSATINGGAGNDTIYGGASPDIIYGAGGNDWIDSGGNGDSVYGGDGNDTIFGNWGNDRITGENGNDFIDGGDGVNVVLASAGNDTITKATIEGPGGDNTPPSSPEPVANDGVVITGFVLYDADKDVPIMPLVDGQVVNLASLPTRNVTIVAEGTWDVQSVKFGYNGNSNYRVDDSVQYVLTGENGRDLIGFTPSVGQHTITATGYVGDGAKGRAGPTSTLRVTFADGTTTTNPPPTTPSNPVVSGSASIAVDKTTFLPGQSVFVNGLGTQLTAGTSMTAKYEWDFGDPNGSHNTLVGFNAAHSYDRPGTYTVKLTVTDEAGKTKTATTQVTVSNDTRRVIYVSGSGNDANDGSSESKAVKTASRAAQLLDNNTRILFRRGETFNLTSGIYVGKANVEIGAYGSGNVSVLKRANGSMWELIKLGNTATDVVIRDLAFDTDTPNNLDKTGAANGVSAQGTRITIRDCRFLGVSDAINGNGKPRGLLVQNNVAPEYNSIRSYFVWLEGTDVVVVGNKVVNSTREHIIRVGGADRVLMAFNDFSNQDRSWAGDWRDIAKGTFTIQKGSYIYVTRNKVSYGGIGVGPLGGPDGKDDANARSSWVVVDGNEVVGINLTVSAGSEHVALRNNVIRRDTNDGIWLRPVDSYVVNGTNIYSSRNIYDLTIANNTMIDNGQNGNFLLISGRGAAGQVTLVNNLLVAPNMLTGQSQTAAVYIADNQAGSMNVFKRVAGNVWDNLKTLSYAQGGYFYSYGWWSDPSGYLTPQEWDQMVANGDRYGSVGINGTTYAPASWSTAASGSTAVAGVFFDLNGKSRNTTGTVTAGAVQL